MSNQGVHRFLDLEGRVKQWPKKLNDKLEVLNYLAAKFNATTTYDEKSVNELLKQWHTFGDWSLLRRDLCEQGFLDRNRAGTEYTRTAKSLD